MQIAELKNNKTEFHVKVTIPAKELSKEVDKELKEIAKTAKMNGFRVGKVPQHILKQKHQVSIRHDVVRKKLNSTVDELIKKNELNVTMDPAIEDLKNEDGKDLEFTIKFDLIPKISLPDFKKISIEQPVLQLTDKETDQELDKMAEYMKAFDKESKGKAAKGDQLTIDAVGYVDDKAFDGGKLDGHKLVLGSKAFIPGFEDQLIGSKAGEDVSVKVDFPEEYHAKELAGKPSEFKVKVTAVHKPEISKIDDEFAKKFKCENLDELKKQVTDRLVKGYEEQVYLLMKMKLFDQLEEILTFDVPPALVDKELDIIKKQSQGSDNPDLDKKSDQEKEEYFKKISTRRVRIGLIIAEYVKKNNLQITEGDIRQAIIAQARNYPGQEKQIFEFYQKDRQALESLKGPILEEKSVKDIFDKEIVTTTKGYSRDKLDKLLTEDE